MFRKLPGVIENQKPIPGIPYRVEVDYDPIQEAYEVYLPALPRHTFCAAGDTIEEARQSLSENFARVLPWYSKQVQSLPPPDFRPVTKPTNLTAQAQQPGLLSNIGPMAQ